MNKYGGVYFLIEEMHIRSGELYLRHLCGHLKDLGKERNVRSMSQVGRPWANSPSFLLIWDPATGKNANFFSGRY